MILKDNIKINNEIYKTQAQKSLEMLNELEKNSYKAERDERERWKSIFVMAFENNEAELIRKQDKVKEDEEEAQAKAAAHQKTSADDYQENEETNLTGDKVEKDKPLRDSKCICF